MAIGSTLILKPRSAWYSGLADSQQAPLPITQQTLWKRMHEQGLLHRETGQQKIKCGPPLAANVSMLSVYPLSMSKKPVLPVQPVHTRCKINKINTHRWIYFLYGTSKNRSTARQ